MSEYGNYVIVNSAGSRLSGHYPNAFSGKLAFRRGDYIIFGTKKEAESFLRSITRRGYGKNLKIRKR
tara:strand:- start:55 stop:255 length:201 start_codon:yes stop_codon:yes gene_type:complete